MDGTNIAKEIFNSKLPVRVYHGNTSTYIQVFRASYLLIELKTFIPENSKFPYFTDKLTNLPLKWHITTVQNQCGKELHMLEIDKTS